MHQLVISGNLATVRNYHWYVYAGVNKYGVAVFSFDSTFYTACHVGSLTPEYFRELADTLGIDVINTGVRRQDEDKNRMLIYPDDAKILIVHPNWTKFNKFVPKKIFKMGALVRYAFRMGKYDLFSRKRYVEEAIEPMLITDEWLAEEFDAWI